jgi:hypothetical protein
MRKGQRWPDIVANRQRMQRECAHIDFCILATVSIMNVLHVPDFYRAWRADGLIDPGQMQLNILFEPAYYNVRTLPAELKDRVEDAYRSFIGELTAEGTQTANLRSDCLALIDYMRAEQWNELPDFRRFTTALDGLRGESFADTFPELGELLDGTAVAEIATTGETHLETARRLRSAGDVRGALAHFSAAAREAPAGTVAFVDARLAEGGPFLLPGDDASKDMDLFTTVDFAYFIRGVAKQALGDVEGAAADFARTAAQPALLDAIGSGQNRETC